MNLKIIHTAQHRNGVQGAPFTALIFKDRGAEGSVKLGIVFDEPHHVAVFDLQKLASQNIAFGSNSWRGDWYESALRDAINNSLV